LTQTLGFNTTISLLLAAPPWILATICCCLNAWHAGTAPPLGLWERVNATLQIEQGNDSSILLDGGGVSS
ncbi:hypothetical protein MPER_00416, partial [Moniliophthora perniciosa FA553]